MTYAEAVNKAKEESWDKKKTLYVVMIGDNALIVTPAQYRKAHAEEPYTKVYGNYAERVPAA